MNRIEYFQKELDVIRGYDEDVANAAAIMLNLLPDYFFVVPASSTGKYHPNYALGPGGLTRHTKAAFGIGASLLSLEQYDDNYFAGEDIIAPLSKIKALILVSLLNHDGCKSGKTDGKSTYTMYDHPLLVGELLTENYALMSEHINKADLHFVTSLIASHMGQWNTNRSKVEILPKPKTNAEQFVHLCDYLASRKFLEYVFDETLDANGQVTFDLPAPAEPKPIVRSEVRFPFGKHKGETVQDIFSHDPGYIRWAKENLQLREPILQAVNMVLGL